MKTINLLSLCFSLGIVLFLAGHASAIDLGDVPGSSEVLQKGKQHLQGESEVTLGPTEGSGLVEVLMQQLGVTQPQAEGGAGALFQLAKSRMPARNFSALSNSIPDMQNLLAAAPANGALGSGGMAGIFRQLDLSPDMVQKFIPTIVQYVQNTSGSALATSLQSALMGGMM
jgi:hypothetical protein